MASLINILKKFASVNNSVINSVELTQDSSGVYTVRVHLRPHANHACRCPICGRKGNIYDKAKKERCWRALDCGGIIIKLYYAANRIECPVHDVITESVPWAFRDSRFTKDFDLMATYLALKINRSEAAKLLRCDWHTIMRCISRARDFLEPDIKKRYDNLVNIGIDETSYRKGHNYLTVVVDLASDTVVWCAPGHGKEVLSGFFKELTRKQLDSIKTVAGDGAKWIDACMREYVPNAARCIDPFHVVSWGNECLEAVRKELWREARKDAKKLESETDKKRGRPKKEDKESQKTKEAERMIKQISMFKHTGGKAPEHLTERQKLNMEFLAKTSPKLFRAYSMKEKLRLILKLEDINELKAELKKFYYWATHGRIPEFIELAHKIRRHEANIINTATCRQTGAKVESMNNKIKLYIRKGYGFRNIQNLEDFVLLGCSKIAIPLPNRGNDGQKAA